MKVTLRAAHANDAKAIKQCVAAAYQKYIERMGKPPGPMLDDYAEMIQQPNQQCRIFVAEHEEKSEEEANIAGVLVLIPKDQHMLLDNVAVHPLQQGKGIGKQLLQLAESETRKSGYAVLELYTHECMNENIDLYQRNGYVETTRRTEHGYQRVYMQKLLN